MVFNLSLIKQFYIQKFSDLGLKTKWRLFESLHVNISIYNTVEIQYIKLYKYTYTEKQLYI